MFSARKSLVSERRITPRVGMRVWLTALFMLVTAVAGVAAYEIVRPIIEDNLDRSSKASFQQVGDQFEIRLRQLEQNDQDLTVQRIQAFANTRGVQWAIVRARDNERLAGNAEDWLRPVVVSAVEERRPRDNLVPIESGDRVGQRQATYAVPVNARGTLEGADGTAVVFNRFFTAGDVENVDETLRDIDRIALIAGGLALFISGLAGYLVASLIARRVGRLGVAARRIAAGNFDERIRTHVEDEVGRLGDTFNAMASSLKGAFQQVEHEKERGGAILDGMTDAVIGVDGELNVVFQNPRARELLEASDLAFQTRLQETLAKTRYSGPITEPEAEAGDRIIEIRAAPLEDGALAILRDVTEERRVQQAKAQFIANASHELKTPLTALSGYLEMLEDEEDEEYRARFLEDMRLQTERLKGVAQTLLDLSRLDANAVVFRSERVDLEEVLHELRRDFGYTGRRIEVRAEKGVPPVQTDPTQVHRMLAILVDNAIKYSDGDDPVEIGLRREAGRAVVSVADRGCGIPEAEIPHIFERFYRATGSSRADGTGLGLALAHEISEHIGAEIRVHSTPDVGSTFSVSLPISYTPHQGTPLPPKQKELSAST